MVKISKTPSDAIEEYNPTTTDPPHGKIPSIEGEESISGDEPVPSSDDDTLKNAHAVGTQLDEDPKHPKELDLGGDIDKAEEYQKEH